VRSGAWATPRCDELREHAATCSECSEEALVAGWLDGESSHAAAEARLPDAGLVFWKAQLLAKRAAADRAAEPILYAERIARVACAAGVVAVLVWQRSNLGEWILHANPLAVVSVAAAILFTGFTVYAIRAEE
jgi:hypothetical protein